jgi:hypothetical protein
MAYDPINAPGAIYNRVPQSLEEDAEQVMRKLLGEPEPEESRYARMVRLNETREEAVVAKLQTLSTKKLLRLRCYNYFYLDSFDVYGETDGNVIFEGVNVGKQYIQKIIRDILATREHIPRKSK